MELFGFSIGKSKKNVEEIERSPVAPETDDGTQVSDFSSSSALASYYGYFVDLDGTTKNEIQAMQTYREIALYPEVDEAVQDIVNEAIPHEEETALVELVTDRLKEEYSDVIRNKIDDSFKDVLRLLKFSSKASDIFRRWYIDGRLYYNVLIDEKNPASGIVELRPIDATKIKKIAELLKEKDPISGTEIITGKKEYYVFSERGFGSNTNPNQPSQSQTVSGVKMTPDSVVFIPSGFNDTNSGSVLGYLQKAIRPANQLRMLEDAIVIYRWSRAPERRIFYIDVGTLPKAKAEQYVKDIMNRYRNKITYDANTGVVRDDKKYLSMMEDFWMPRRDGGKGTEITTLQGGQNLGELTDVEYFKKKLYQSLNLPISRVMPDQGFSLGRSTEITRDEVKFQKFIGKIRRKFTDLFYELLKRQLILKKVINEDEWDDIKDLIAFRFQKDNFFAELKNQEILQSRLEAVQMMDPFLGKYFSVEYVAKNILKMPEDEIEKMLKTMDQEYKDHPWWYAARNMAEQQQEMQQQQMDMQQQQADAMQQDPQMGQPQDQVDPAQQEPQPWQPQ